MGLFEKLLPDTIPLTEEQFKTFLEQTVLTEHSRCILDGLTAQNAATAPAQGAGMATKGRPCPPPKSPIQRGRTVWAGRKGKRVYRGVSMGVVSYHSCCYELLSTSQDYMSGYLGRWTTAQEYAILDIPVDDNMHLEFWRK